MGVIKDTKIHKAVGIRGYKFARCFLLVDRVGRIDKSQLVFSSLLLNTKFSKSRGYNHLT